MSSTSGTNSNINKSDKNENIHFLKSEEYLSTEKSIKITEEEINNFSNSDLVIQNQNFMQQINHLTKEKNGLESQLVIIKMKFAELSSSYAEEQDEKIEIKNKYEEANQKVLLKEDLIEKLLKQIEKECYDNNTTHLKKIDPNYNVNNNKYRSENSNFTTRLDNNYNPNNNKNIKKEFYGLDDIEETQDNYMTTIGIHENLSRKSEDFNNNTGYNKTENLQNIKNYKDLKKKDKTKSNSIIGSIKGFFNKSDKK